METKRCIKCKQIKSLSEFRKRSDRLSGCRSECKKCEHELRDLRRKAHPKANIAKALSNRGVKIGTIEVVKECEICGTGGKLHRHHEDYDKPYEVIWLCPQCHINLHVEKRKLLTPANVASPAY